jgi:acyl-coenzyme A thioesterase PaaI-like protein
LIQQPSSSAAATSILRWWNRLSGLPGGLWLFSRLIGWKAPYSATIRAHVDEISPGYARVSLKDRYRVRNHLKSIHAIALINLGEIATGLAVLTAIPENMRGIVLGLNAEYLKKARGKLSATAEFKLPDEIIENTACEVTAELKDQSGDIVTIVRATWMIGPKS